MLQRLMRTGFVVEARVFGDEAAEVVFPEDENVIEQLSTERANEAFGERIHVGRAWCRPHDPNADAREGGGERAAKLPVAIADEDLRPDVHRGVAGLWAHHASVGE
jgi:hypothetical protein